MCGLVGIFDTMGTARPDPLLLRRMNDTLSHRGPDGDGIYTGDGIGLGHRRLSIIDLEGGVQPLANGDGSVTVVFNGEIYNFQEIAAELKALGHRFRTHSDTEVIVHGWEEWGKDCLSRFRGMFAFALWDAPQNTLFLARDRLGKKPLYYSTLPNGTVIFGSELKALEAHPDFQRDIDPCAVEDYFAFGYIPDPRSIYKGVHKLPPAHYIEWRRDPTGQNQPPLCQPYWDMEFRETTVTDLAEAQKQLNDHLKEAVRLRLISDVPLGAFLSGGVDSSGVVAMMAEVMDEPVNTFSIAFGHKEFDETPYATRVAELYGTNHHSQEVDPDSFDLVDRLADIYDEPFGDSSAMPTYRVCAEARKGVTVALSGDGGDEFFAGYRRYLFHRREEKIRSLMPYFLRRPLFGLLAKIYPKMDWAPRFLRAKTTFHELSLDEVGSYFNSISYLSDSMRNGIFSAAFKHDLKGYHAADVLKGHFDKAGTDDPLSRAQYVDIKTWLPGDILTKVDRASMANSLEVRSPLLDHKLVEWSAGLASSLKLNGSEGKYILKKVFEPYLPHDLMYRPKRGFSVPLAAWFRGPLKDKVRHAVTGQTLAESGFFNMKHLEKLVDQHQSSRYDHSTALWSLLMFESFLRRKLS